MLPREDDRLKLLSQTARHSVLRRARLNAEKVQQWGSSCKSTAMTTVIGGTRCSTTEIGLVPNPMYSITSAAPVWDVTGSKSNN